MEWEETRAVHLLHTISFRRCTCNGVEKMQEVGWASITCSNETYGGARTAKKRVKRRSTHLHTFHYRRYIPLAAERSATLFVPCRGKEAAKNRGTGMHVVWRCGKGVKKMHSTVLHVNFPFLKEFA